MGIQCKPIGKNKSLHKRLENKLVKEAAAKANRSASKKK